MYESEDEKTMQTLFEMTDFVKFKDAMIKSKLAIAKDQVAINEYANVDATETGEDFFWSMNSENYEDPVTGWRKMTSFD